MFLIHYFRILNNSDTYKQLYSKLENIIDYIFIFITIFYFQPILNTICYFVLFEV